MTGKERRRFQRLRPPHPVRGAVGTARVYVLDGSIGGVGVLHENTLPQPGDICRVEILSDVGPITLDCEVVRTVQRSSGENGVSRPLFQSGLRVIAADHQSAQRLRTTFGANAAKRGHSQDN